jgi:DNA-binding winged helix-turn-helix (wHTH) protein
VIYRFGGFELEPDRYVLARGGTPVEIEPKVFELLRHLVASSATREATS